MQINSDLVWKYWANEFGTNLITFPDKYNELIFEIERGESAVRYSIHVCKTQLTTTELYYKSGQCTTTTNYESVTVVATNTYVRIANVYDCGKEITSISELRVFYR